MVRNPESKTVLKSLSDCTWGERGKVVLGLGYQVSAWCDNMYVKYVRHVLRSPSCELHRKTSSFDKFTFFRVDEETRNHEKPKTTSDNISENLLVFLLTKNREPGAKKGKPRTARNTKPGEPKHAKTEKLALKRWLKPKLPTPPLVRRNFVMSESGNVKVNQPDFLVKVGNMLDMVGIPAVIMIL